jgi:hypothetical protein
MTQQEPSSAGLGFEGHLQRMAKLKAERESLQRQLMLLNVTIAIVRAKGSERDWPEDFPHENGVYNNWCCSCKKNFLGYKRRVICKLCSGDPQTGSVVTESVSL